MYFGLENLPHPLQRHSALLLPKVGNQVEVAAVNIAIAWVEGKAAIVVVVVAVEAVAEVDVVVKTKIV